MRRCAPPAACRGFTLLEIVIVLAIVAVLAALASAAYGRYRDRVLVTQAVSDIGAMSAAIKLYERDERALPGSLDDIGAGKRLDPWGRPYQYVNPGVKGEVDVFSYGADGQPGGEGNDADIGSWQ